MGRKKIPIDASLVEKLAMIQCTPREIGAIVGCSEDTICRNFADIMAKGKEMGKMSIRRAMFEKAKAGNATLLIWLSKQHLGMTDKVEQKIDQNIVEQAQTLMALPTETLEKIVKEEIKKNQ